MTSDNIENLDLKEYANRAKSKSNNILLHSFKYVSIQANF